MSTGKFALSGSQKKALADFASLPAVNPGELVRVTLRLRRKSPLPKWTGQTMTPGQHASRHGATREDLHKVESFAKANSLKIRRSHLGAREVVMEGNAAQMQKAFGVELKAVQIGNSVRRVRSGEIWLPETLVNLVTSVTGLDNRPFAKPHYRIGDTIARVAVEAPGEGAAAAGPAAVVAPAFPGFSGADLARLYNFPEGASGAGQSIAILEMGGGFRAEELSASFTELGVQRAGAEVVAFDGCGGNNPGVNARDPFCRDPEVMLDLQVAGAAAPGAKLLVYFAPDDSDQSFLAAFSAAVHDAANKPSIVSISWGGPEGQATQQFRDEFDQILQSAAHLGITVCVATGDNAYADYDVGDPDWDKGANVDFPASSPWALACGGTKIVVDAGGIEAETVWFDGPNDGAGGGIGRYFPVPDYQAPTTIPRAVQPDGPPMRGTPDIAADAAPSSGYRILCDGVRFPDAANGIAAMGGTSAVAPLWAALVARLNEALGAPCGFLNSDLYAIAATANQTAFREVTSGTNGAYAAGPGWNPCTGLGSVNGTNLLTALRERKRISDTKTK